MTTATGGMAAIYARLSQNRTDEHLGTERQLAACRTTARNLGLEVSESHVYVDDGVSAWSGQERPGFQSLLDSMASRSITTVLAYAPDRLARSMEDYVLLMGVAKGAGVRIHTVVGGDQDPTDPNRALASGVQALVNSWESDIKSTRIKAAAKQRALRGLPYTGARKFGYTPDHMALVEPEAAELAVSIRNVLAGASIRSQARRLNDLGLLTPSRKARDGSEKGRRTWNGSSLRQTIVRPALAGIVTYKGEVLPDVEARWPSIVTPAEHTALVAMLSNPARVTNGGKGPDPKSLLVGIGKCGAPGCTDHLVTTTQRRGGETVKLYRCRQAADPKSKGGSHVTRRLDAVDTYVYQALVARLERGDIQTALATSQGEDMAALVSERDTVRRQLDDVAQAVVAGAFTVSQAATMSTGLQERLETLDRALAASDKSGVLEVVGTIVDPVKWLVSASLESRRAVLDALVTVTILPQRPGRGFDPEAVRLDWKV